MRGVGDESLHIDTVFQHQDFCKLVICNATTFWDGGQN